MAKRTKNRVLIIVENLPVPLDRRVWQEANVLKQAGYDVGVICPKTKDFPKSREVIDGIRIYRHPMAPEGTGAFGYLFEYITALFWETILSFQYRMKHGIDVIQACNPPDLIFLVAWLHKPFGVKFIYDQHDLNPELYEAKFNKKGFFHKLLTFFERRSYRTANAVISTNETFREIAKTRGSVPENQVYIVRNVPNLATFKRTTPATDIAPAGTQIIGYVGIIGDQDGVDNLVRAMGHITQTLGRTNVHCVIIGDGTALADLKTLADEIGVSNVITFAGYQRPPRLFELLSACDVGVIPDPPNSFNNKISMNKVFEYFAMGIPFVMYNLEQSARDARGACLTVDEATPEALGEGIVRLLDDPELRTHFSQTGAGVVRDSVNWNDEARNLVAAYHSVLPLSRA